MTALLVLPDGREIYSGEVGQDAILRLTLTAGVNDTSGQSGAGMTANADRLWVELGETTLADVQTALGTQGVTLKEDELIPVVAAPGAAGTAWGVIQ